MYVCSAILAYAVVSMLTCTVPVARVHPKHPSLLLSL